MFLCTKISVSIKKQLKMLKNSKNAYFIDKMALFRARKAILSKKRQNRLTKNYGGYILVCGIGNWRGMFPLKIKPVVKERNLMGDD